MRNICVDGFQRISKSAARRAFNAGDPVYLCAVNLRPGGPWHPEICLWRTGENFEKSVAAFEFYNCINGETGKYAAYYIEA